MLLQRAIFLRGVFDPADATRITTTLYRPKHADLRCEGSFVCSGDLMVPIGNVVEMKVLQEGQLETAKQETAGPAARVVRVHAAIVNDQTVTEEAEASEEMSIEEAPAVRRRGRPRRIPAVIGPDTQ